MIGRNEGARLTRCLESVISSGGIVVYVDSASTDDSLSRARACGVHVVELDMTVDDALKYIISMGVMVPPMRGTTPTADALKPPAA